jgi:hypothetical protein
MSRVVLHGAPMGIWCALDEDEAVITKNFNITLEKTSATSLRPSTNDFRRLAQSEAT